MGTEKTQNKTEEGPANNDGPTDGRTFEQKLVVLLKTRLKILETQKEIYQKLKREDAPTIGQEKLYQMDIVRTEGAIEEVSYLIKMTHIK